MASSQSPLVSYPQIYPHLSPSPSISQSSNGVSRYQSPHRSLFEQPQHQRSSPTVDHTEIHGTPSEVPTCTESTETVGTQGGVRTGTHGIQSQEGFLGAVRTGTVGTQG